MSISINMKRNTNKNMYLIKQKSLNFSFKGDRTVTFSNQNLHKTVTVRSRNQNIIEMLYFLLKILKKKISKIYGLTYE